MYQNVILNTEAAIYKSEDDSVFQYEKNETLNSWEFDI